MQVDDWALAGQPGTGASSQISVTPYAAGLSGRPSMQSVSLGTAPVFGSAQRCTTMGERWLLPSINSGWNVGETSPGDDPPSIIRLTSAGHPSHAASAARL